MRAALGLPLAAIVLLGGCGDMERKLDEVLPRKSARYETSKSLPPLEIPPGLSTTGIREAYPVPGSGTATYSEYSGRSSGTRQVAGAGVLPEVPNVRVDRSGDKRWLVVRAEPGVLWPRLRDFWLENGFVLKFEDPGIGIMETDWAERRADLPTGFLRGLLQKINRFAYAYATRDKFRTRLERGQEPGTTEVYISHQGAEEVTQGDTYVWQPRAPDPELEAEMLNRLMVSLGLDEQEAERMIARSRPDRAPRATLVREQDGAVFLALREGFDRAWRRTGLALDRVGFAVEDRDRSRGLFYVRYVDPLAEGGQKEKGFFSRLRFWRRDEPPPREEYLISLEGGKGATRVVVLDTRGRPAVGATAERILAVLEEQLR